MLRSEINEIIRQGREFMASFGFTLPPFANWSPHQLVESGQPGIIDANLGWDITDYNQGKFNDLGLLLFTLRNGNSNNLKTGKGMLYAEKLMISRKNQLTPMHRHIVKTEDIINRGGGRLVLELFMVDENGGVDHDAPVQVLSDGNIVKLPPGGKLSLNPGQSVPLLPEVWHA
ncbi:MAG: D-lyxose/D-mannose family sugar isomerase, partial [Rhizobiaceae bacterium]|nr:D-lyxose/D-mannose family sugar isomerase [Rhizobiaceae bacterium]